MAFYNKKPVFRDRYIGFQSMVSILQVKDSMQFTKNEPSDNATLQPTEFPTKGLTSMKIN